MVTITLIETPAMHFDQLLTFRNEFAFHARSRSAPGRMSFLPYGSLELAALNELVAQLVEQRPFKAWVLGSIPSELTTRLASSWFPAFRR